MQEAKSEELDCVPTANPTEEQKEVPQGRQDAEEDDGNQDEEESSSEAAPTYGVWRRLRNMLLIFAAIWLLMTLLRTSGNRRSKVILANRYSEDFKYRPAASPIITEHLTDGRTRIRGAEPTARTVPPAKEKEKQKSKSKKRRHVAISHEHECSKWQLFFAQKFYALFQRWTHNQHESTAPLPDGDILVHAGDLTQSATSEELENAFSWLSGQSHAHKFFIAGNHDATLTDPDVITHLRTAHPSLTYLQDSETMVTVRGRTLNVYGGPYTSRYGSWPFQYPRVHPSHSTTSTQRANIPFRTDILISHGPPAHHPDNDGVGCVALLRALWRVRPPLHVFGHIHGARGMEDVFWTAGQKAYEALCEKRGGWWNLLVVLAACVWSGKGKGMWTTLVNASVVGGDRGKLRRSAIVVDI